jgi:putative effector of murein hydrolase
MLNFFFIVVIYSQFRTPSAFPSYISYILLFKTAILFRIQIDYRDFKILRFVYLLFCLDICSTIKK